MRTRNRIATGALLVALVALATWALQTPPVVVELEDHPPIRRAEATDLALLTADPMPGAIEAVGVVLEPVAQRDPGHGEPAARILEQTWEEVALLVVELGYELRDHRA